MKSNEWTSIIDIVNAIGSFKGEQKDKSYFAREQIKFDKFLREA